MIKTTGVGESSCLIRNIKNMLERWSSCRNSSLCSCEREFYYMFPSFGLEINESGESRVSSSDFISNAVHTINANIANNIIPTPLYTPQHTLSTLKYIKFNKIIALWPGLNFICTLSLPPGSGFTRNTHIFTWLNLPSRCDNIHKRLLLLTWIESSIWPGWKWGRPRAANGGRHVRLEFASPFPDQMHPHHNSQTCPFGSFVLF